MFSEQFKNTMNNDLKVSKGKITGNKYLLQMFYKLLDDPPGVCGVSPTSLGYVHSFLSR